MNSFFFLKDKIVKSILITTNTIGKFNTNT
jgi:hypothetical protein